MIRKFTLLFILTSGILVSFAQKTGSITLITEKNNPLIFYLDNVRQNDTAVSAITITGLKDNYYLVRSVKADTLYYSRNLVVGDMNENPMDVTYIIKSLPDGKTKTSLYSMMPPNDNFTAPKSLLVMDIKLPSPGMDSSLRVIKKKKIKGLTISQGDKQKADVVEEKSKAIIKKTEVTNVKKPPVKKCNGWPIAKKDFDLVVKTISESKNETLKLKNAKSLINGSCFLVNQLDEIVQLFPTEISKLEFLQFAYAFTIDRPNYNKFEKYFKNEKLKSEFLKIHGE